MGLTLRRIKFKPLNVVYKLLRYLSLAFLCLRLSLSYLPSLSPPAPSLLIHLIPLQGSVLKFTALQVSLPDPQLCQVLLTGETIASQASCHSSCHLIPKLPIYLAARAGHSELSVQFVSFAPGTWLAFSNHESLMSDPVHNSNIEGIISVF